MNGKKAHVKPSKNSLHIIEKLKEQMRDDTPEVHDRLYQNISLS